MKNLKPFITMIIFAAVMLAHTNAAALYDPSKDKANAAPSAAAAPGAKSHAAGSSQDTPFVPGRIIVKFKPETGQKVVLSGYSVQAATQSSIDFLNAKHKVKKITPVFKDLHEKGLTNAPAKAKASIDKLNKKNKRAIDESKIPDLENIYVLELEEGADIKKAVEDYKKDPAVAYAEPDYIATVQLVPNDPYYSSSGSWGQSYDDLWGIKKIQCEQAWDITQGEGTIVAVVDTGVDYTHPDIAANMWDDGSGHCGKDFVNGDNDPMDDHGHGTHCSGTIAAIGNNNLGVIGVAPMAKIMAMKGLDAGGSGYFSALADCVKYAADNGADVISCSWGGPGSSQTLTDAFHYADGLGSVCIAAAGNSNIDVSGFTPANIDTVIAVAATDYQDNKASFSNYGAKIDVAAPGVDVLSLRASGTDMYQDGGSHIVEETYYRANGTSMACPHAAGVVALVRSRNPEFSNEETRSALKITSDQMASTAYIGQGRINSGSAAGMDAPPPVAVLTTSGLLGITADVMGTAKGSSFQNYTLSCGAGASPSKWTILHTSATQVDSGVLYAGFETWRLDDGAYTLKLSVTDTNGRMVEAMQPITISNIFIMTSPIQGDLFAPGDIINITAQTNMPISRYSVETGVGTDPQSWTDEGIVLTGDQNGIIASWDTVGITMNDFYTLKLSYANEYFEKESRSAVYIDNRLDSQWKRTPFSGDVIYLKPCDMDGDGKDEIILQNNSGYMDVLGADGLSLPGWPQPLYGRSSSGSDTNINIEDVDGDGEKEIILAYCYFASPWSYTKLIIRIYKINGKYTENTVDFGLQADNCIFYMHYLACDDINNDSNKDFIYLIYYYPCAGDEVRYKIIAVDNDGSPIQGWPVEGAIHSICPIQDAVYASELYPNLAVADIDKDGIKEVAVLNRNTTFKVFGHDGGPKTQWDRFFLEDTDPRVPAQPVIFIDDINNDGDQETVISINKSTAERDFFNMKKYIYVIDKNNQFLSGFPLFAGDTFYLDNFNSLSVADLDGDNDKEILAELGSMESGLQRTRLAAFHHDGGPVTGFPSQKAPGYRVSHLTADTDNDGCQEIILLTQQWENDKKADPLAPHIFTIDHNGDLLPASGQFYFNEAYGSICLADTDGDGGINLITSQECIYNFKLSPGSGTKPAVTWPMQRYNAVNTNASWRPSLKHAPRLIPIGDKIVSFRGLLQFTISATDQDGDTLTYSAEGLPAGAVFNPETRQFAWTPTLSQMDRYIIKFTVSDGELSDSETIAIDVINYPPVLEPIGNKTVNEGELLSFKVSATDPDGDTIIYSMQPSSEPIAEGATLDPDTGVFSWTPSYLQEGKYYVTFIAFGNDPMWWSGETIIITVNNVNLAPVIEPIGHKKVDEARPLVFSVNGSDDSVLKLIYSVSALPEGASFAEAWAGKLMTGYQFSWTPSFDQAGSYPVTFTVSDGELSASETIVITVNNVDRPPVLNPIGNKSIDEGKLLRFTVSGSDPDGDKLIYSVSSLPKRAIFKQISSVTGTAYQFKWTPAYNQAGKYSITFKISAGNLSASEVITITVNNVNRPPVATRTRMITVKRKIPTPITLTGTDPDNDKLTYIVTQKPLTGLLSGTPPNLVYTADKKGTYYLKYKAYDGNLYSNEATITIAVL